jgi:hypothetical protein
MLLKLALVWAAAVKAPGTFNAFPGAKITGRVLAVDIANW